MCVCSKPWNQTGLACVQSGYRCMTIIKKIRQSEVRRKRVSTTLLCRSMQGRRYPFHQQFNRADYRSCDKSHETTGLATVWRINTSSHTKFKRKHIHRNWSACYLVSSLNVEFWILQRCTTTSTPPAIVLPNAHRVEIPMLAGDKKLDAAVCSLHKRVEKVLHPPTLARNGTRWNCWEAQ